MNEPPEIRVKETVYAFKLKNGYFHAAKSFGTYTDRIHECRFYKSKERCLKEHEGYYEGEVIEVLIEAKS